VRVLAVYLSTYYSTVGIKLRSPRRSIYSLVNRRRTSQKVVAVHLSQTVGKHLAILLVEKPRTGECILRLLRWLLLPHGRQDDVPTVSDVVETGAAGSSDLKTFFGRLPVACNGRVGDRRCRSRTGDRRHEASNRDQAQRRKSVVDDRSMLSAHDCGRTKTN